MYVKGSSVVKMYGGAVKGNVALRQAGGIYVLDNSTFEMFGGGISDNIAFGNGGGVYIWDRATFNLNGGSVDGNNAAYGGGVSLYSSNEDRNKINNVLNLGGGEIKNNTATIFGGGICCFQYSVLNFDGENEITVADNKDTNVFLADKCTFNVVSLAQGSSIGISSIEKIAKGTPKTICTVSDESLADCFFSDSDDCVVKYEEGSITLTADFFTSTVKYVTSTEQNVPDETKKGFTESLTFIVTSESPTLPCKTFLGWAERENSDTATYHGGDSVNVVGEKTLYAVWQDAPHSFVKVDEVPATCTKDGVKAYYKCSSCGKEFVDDANGGKTELTDKSQLVIHGGHKFGPWQEGVEATEEKLGTIAHKDCTVCGKHFDADGKELTDITTTFMPDLEFEGDGCNGTIATNGIVVLTGVLLVAVVLVSRKKNKISR